MGILQALGYHAFCDAPPSETLGHENRKHSPVAPMSLEKDMTEKFSFLVADKTVVTKATDQEEKQEPFGEPSDEACCPFKCASFVRVRRRVNDIRSLRPVARG